MIGFSVISGSAYSMLGNRMKAYKFRGADQIPFALDIMFNNRLYCADWTRLNDPVEGTFVYSYASDSGNDYKKEVDKIIEEKKKLKVCSLSLTFDCHLLWSHYASGFSGLAIEVELPDDNPEVKVVDYRGVFAFVSMEQHRNASETADRVLSSKYNEWAYEKEVRILKRGEWFDLPSPVRRIICGHRMNPSMFEALRIICERKEITINRIGIGDEGLDADFVPPLNENHPTIRSS